MQPSVLCPTAVDLAEVAVLREPGPPNWWFDTPERSDRVRAAITNSGFGLPSGEISSIMPLDSNQRYALDLPLALCVLLCDPAHAHLQRDGWIAWGGLGLDGSLIPIEEPLVNDLGPRPCVGRVWDPTDHIPQPHEDAVVSVVEVETLQQAWDVITAFVSMEPAIFAESG